MSKRSLCLLSVGLAVLPFAAAIAQNAPSAPPTVPPAGPPMTFVTAGLMSRADAVLLVQATLGACDVRGEKAAAVISDPDGNMRAALSSEGMATIGISSTARKTATVLKWRQSTHAMRDRAAADPAFAAEFGKDPRYYFSPGGLPLYRGNQFIGVLAVGGGHQLDEECALDALKSLPWAKTSPATPDASK